MEALQRLDSSGSASVSKCKILLPREQTTGRFLLQVVFVLPTAYPVTQLNLNYASAAVGGTIVLAGGYWIIDAHRWFKGPIANVTQETYASADGKTVM